MRGLYLITNDDPLQFLLEKLDVALATGNIAILQYRRKKVARVAQPSEVQQIKALCEKYQVPFVINDDLALAEQFGLGVHLGQSDGEIIDATARLPEGVIIGRTCLNSLELAEKAIAEGATMLPGQIADTLRDAYHGGDVLQILHRPAVCVSAQRPLLRG